MAYWCTNLIMISFIHLSFDPLGLKPTDDEELKVLQTKELNNGRLAMIAIAGFVLQEVAEPGVEIFEHLFFDIEKEIIEEIDEIETELGLPASIPIPKLPSK
jgi:light-harvesting complex I chlorophyll a/b binding protein 1